MSRQSEIDKVIKVLKGLPSEGTPILMDENGHYLYSYKNLTKVAEHIVDHKETPIRSKNGFRVWLGTNIFSWWLTKLIKPIDYKEE